jgi:hypothetical protein
MAADFESAFEALKAIYTRYADRLHVKADTATNYALYSRVPSPFPQHKGHGMYFGSVQIGKAYVAFHLMPLYMNAQLTASISPALKKRMQGKTCFNFKAVPDGEILVELEKLTGVGFENFRDRGWV